MLTTILALTEIIAEVFSIPENEYAKDLIELVGEREISVKDYKGNISNQIERYMLLKVIKQ